MRTLSTALTTAANASESGWAELWDIYLPEAVAGPFGTTATLRLTRYPGGFDFFTPGIDPEPALTQGDGASYYEWPVERDSAKAVSRETTDSLTITASNVTGEFAAMLATVRWRDARVILRRVPTTSGTLTADDAVLLFSGLVDRCTVTLERIQLVCSSDLGSLSVVKPAHGFQPPCRFRWADDDCGAIRYHSANYQAGTCSGTGTTTWIPVTVAADTGSASTYGTDLVDALADGDITDSGSAPGYEGYRCKYSYTGVWTGLESDWGNRANKVWALEDFAAGYENTALGPRIRFDFGSAVAVNIWHIQPSFGAERQHIPRVIQFAGSNDATNYDFIGYYEMPPLKDTLSEIVWHHVIPYRYVRLAIRSKWQSGFSPFHFGTIRAFTGSRHYWRHGIVRFADDTLTAELRGVRRILIGSYADGLSPGAPLPAVPQAGDTFTLERGCGKGFNDCTQRQRLPFFGGFPQISNEPVADV